MALFKCKMCGGALEINNNETVVTCEYCGTQQTLPKLDDDKRANMYDRANHFRRNNEFDKAMGIYEQILNEDNTDAEAYWSLVLCRYGIEYVEDPSSHKRVPTVNRAQFTSIFDDDNYKSALQYADGYQRSVYEKEAKAINEIQKGILAISQKEEPFDVFICYKETDNNGRRTPDSVLATDLYHQLTQEGFKVFFARITLEDKLGSAYEPYIFAALNSAKVMVVLGTKPEYFNAVWVKNEWSRYLALIKQGQKKMLIPAYKDMDPYDLPEEFSHLQAQDMSKLGFMQDLIRGIKKILEADAPKTTTVVKETVVTGGNANVAPLLKRAFMFLEDGEWESADEYCEKVLDIDPECAEAYLGKLMSEMQVYKCEELKKQKVPFDKRGNYVKAVRFGDEKLKAELQGYIDYIVNRNFKAAYADAMSTMVTAKTEQQYKSAAAKFERIRNYKDAGERAKECLEKAEETKLSTLYADAVSAMNSADTEQQYKSAADKFSAIKTFKDAEDKAKLCLEKVEEIRLETLYSAAMAALEKASTEEQYKNAASKFTEVASYKDAPHRVQECLGKADFVYKEDIYNTATVAMQEDTVSSLKVAISLYKDIAGWTDSTEKCETCERRIQEINEQKEIERAELARMADKKAKKRKAILTITTLIACACIAFFIILNTVIIPNGKYEDAIALMDSEKYEEAVALFDEIPDYKDAGEKRKEALYLYAVSYQDGEQYENAITTFEQIKDYKDSNDRIAVCQTAILDNKYSAALALMKEGKYENAITAFEEIKTHKDSSTQISTCMSTLANSYASKGDTTNAIKWYEKMGNKDSANKVRYDYVLANKNNTNTTTYEYLKTLKSAGYKDSASVYEKLYSWSVNLCMNADKINHSSKASTIPQSTGDPYVHYSVSGGYPGQVFKLKLVHETRLKPGLGNNPLEDWKVEDRSLATREKELKATDGCQCIDLYPTGSNLVYHRVTIYDEETGKQLASVTVYTPYY